MSRNGVIPFPVVRKKSCPLYHDAQLLNREPEVFCRTKAGCGGSDSPRSVQTVRAEFAKNKMALQKATPELDLFSSAKGVRAVLAPTAFGRSCQRRDGRGLR
jgi:hypothetical protein